MRTLIPLCAAALVLSACGKKDESHENPSAATPAESMPANESMPMNQPMPAAGATAQLAPTQGHSAAGTLTLSSEGGAVKISGSITGLPPNAEFGFHIHEKGDCSAPDASSAGGHFNPAGAPHGDPNMEDDGHHAGDMPNAKSDAQGVAQIDAEVHHLVSLNDIVGKAIVMHEKPDDYKTQPSGNSGARIACGVIAGG